MCKYIEFAIGVAIGAAAMVVGQTNILAAAALVMTATAAAMVLPVGE